MLADEGHFRGGKQAEAENPISVDAENNHAPANTGRFKKPAFEE